MPGMTDQLPATLIVNTLNGALGLLNQAREFAKHSKDIELKQKLSEIQDALMEVKDEVNKLSDDNEELRKRLLQKENVKLKGEFGYFYKDGDDSPLCPKCFQKDGKEVFLPPLEEWGNDGLRRKCTVCDYVKFERRPKADKVLSSRSDWQDISGYTR